MKLHRSFPNGLGAGKSTTPFRLVDYVRNSTRVAVSTGDRGAAIHDASDHGPEAPKVGNSAAAWRLPTASNFPTTHDLGCQAASIDM